MTHLTGSQKKLKSSIEAMFGIDNLFTESRLPRYIDARTFFAQYLRRNERLSLTETANIFNKKVPLILHYQKRFDKITAYDRYMQDKWNDIVSAEYGEVSKESKDIASKVVKLVNQLNDKSKIDDLLTKVGYLIKGYNGCRA